MAAEQRASVQVEPGSRGHDAITATAVRRIDRLIDNLVIMGMGEPLANYDNLLKALRS